MTEMTPASQPQMGPAAEPRASRTAAVAKFVMVVVLFAVIAFAVTETVPWYRPVGGGEDAQGIADALFDRYVVAFEILGLLLTAALLGAMYLAFREATP